MEFCIIGVFADILLRSAEILWGMTQKKRSVFISAIVKLLPEKVSLKNWCWWAQDNPESRQNGSLEKVDAFGFF